MTQHRFKRGDRAQLTARGNIECKGWQLDGCVGTVKELSDFGPVAHVDFGHGQAYWLEEYLLRGGQ